MNPAKLDTIEEHPSEQGMEVHPAIQMILARMESDPQEFFTHKNNRPMARAQTTFAITASQTIEQTKSMWNRKEKRLYNQALRRVRLEEMHQRLMRALLIKQEGANQ